METYIPSQPSERHAWGEGYPTRTHCQGSIRIKTQTGVLRQVPEILALDRSVHGDVEVPQPIQERVETTRVGGDADWSQEILECSSRAHVAILTASASAKNSAEKAKVGLLAQVQKNWLSPTSAEVAKEQVGV